MEKNSNDAAAQWLRSPLTEKAERLRPVRELVLEPYHGRRRKLKVFRTRYLLGSGEDCDIRFNDPFVCPRHAEIRLDEEGYRIVDMGSRNGIYLNGVKVMSAPLFRQGSLRIGRSQIHWRPEEESAAGEGELVAEDPAMRAIVESVRQAARSGLPVLLLGETGTGKELLARMIHRASARSGQSYVALNGALTGGALAESELFGHTKGAFTGAEKARRGALRRADRGTLFLDEVADIPLSAQVALLRALEAGEVRPLGADDAERVDFRLVSATSQDLDSRIAAGAFRLDLYYRLAGFVVHVPPLRERPLDILAFSRRSLEAAGLELDRECEGKLLSYPWPGNVRELKSCLERAALLAKAAESPRVLPPHIQGLGQVAPPRPPGRGRSLEEVERECIHSALERNGWSKGVSAKELGIARSTLFEKMRKYSLRD